MQSFAPSKTPSLWTSLIRRPHSCRCLLWYYIAECYSHTLLCVRLDASNRFYTTIPHRFSGDNTAVCVLGVQRARFPLTPTPRGTKLPVHATPPVIKTQKQLKEKIDMLQSLVDVAVASNLMKENAKVCHTVRVWVAALSRAAC